MNKVFYRCVFVLSILNVMCCYGMDLVCASDAVSSNSYQKQIDILGEEIAQLSQNLREYKKFDNNLDGKIEALSDELAKYQKNVNTQLVAYSKSNQELISQNAELKENFTILETQYSVLDTKLLSLKADMVLLQINKKTSDPAPQDVTSRLQQKAQAIFSKNTLLKALIAGLFYGKFDTYHVLYYMISDIGYSLYIKKFGMELSCVVAGIMIYCFFYIHTNASYPILIGFVSAALS